MMMKKQKMHAILKLVSARAEVIGGATLSTLYSRVPSIIFSHKSRKISLR